jgi:hypothetical protein
MIMCCNAAGASILAWRGMWIQSIAVGSKTFIEMLKEVLGFRATGRKII